METKLTAKTFKDFFKNQPIPLEVRVRTIPTKTKWIDIWFRGEKEFSEEIRKKCLQIIYPNSPNLHVSPYCAGNVGRRSICMTESEWMKFFEENQ